MVGQPNRWRVRVAGAGDCHACVGAPQEADPDTWTITVGIEPYARGLKYLSRAKPPESFVVPADEVARAAES